MNPFPADLVIFDCDGVLVDSEPLVNRLYVDMLGECGFAVDYDESLHEFAGAAMATRIEVWSRRLCWQPDPGFVAVFQQRLFAIMAKELKPIAGVGEVLAGLRVPCCVASNGNPEEIAFRLQTCRLDEYFDGALFSGTRVPRPKPYPDVFLAAARAFDTDPSRCIVVEDSITGVTAARAAGMHVYGYAALTSAAALEQAGAVPFAAMSELPLLLESGSRAG